MYMNILMCFISLIKRYLGLKKKKKKEYWSGLPFPSPGDLPDPGIESRSPAMQADSLPPEPPGKPPHDHGLS